MTVVAPVGASDVLDEREGNGPTPVHSQISMQAGIISPGKTVEYSFPEGQDRKSYIHVVQTSGYNTLASKGNRVRVNGGLELSEGDGSFAWGKVGDKLEIENVGSGPAEILVFDIE